MGPGIDGVGRAAAVFADPAHRTEIRRMHEDEVPFLDMIDQLGLAGFDGRLRATIAALTPEQVTIIREAMVAELDRIGPGGGTDWPIDCDLDSVPAAVDVTPIRVAGRPVARITGAAG